VPDPTTALNMYRNDELDIAPVAANELQGVRQDQMLKNEIQYWPAAQVLFMGLNERKIAAFKDVRVRQSFAYAIDRETICNHVFFGAWAQALQLVPAGIPGHNVQSELTYDPERARRLIADAGFPGGRGFPAIELAVAGNTDSTAAEAIAAQLERNLSVKVYARPIEHGAFVAGLQGHHWDAFLVGWTADYLSAEQMLYRYLHHAEPMNFVDYYSPIFERVLDSAMHAKTVDAEETLLRKANQIATTEAALIPIAYGKFIFLVKPTVSGFAANLFEPMGFETVHKGRLSRE